MSSFNLVPIKAAFLTFFHFFLTFIKFLMLCVAAVRYNHRRRDHL